MKTSVAICTYNGSRFLAEQLSSIVGQTRPPDEVVLSDDGSTDGTIEVIEKFANTACLPVKYTRNHCNLGSAANFHQALRMCSGDIVFLSDQDDVWVPVKIEVTCRLMENFPQAGFAFSNALLVDEHLNSLEQSLWDLVPFTPGCRYSCLELLEETANRNIVTGATMALRRSFAKTVPLPPSDWVHDAWYALWISSFAPAVAIDEPLIWYRQHSQQQIGIRGREARSIARRIISGLASQTVRNNLMEAVKFLRKQEHGMKCVASTVTETQSAICPANEASTKLDAWELRQSYFERVRSQVKQRIAHLESRIAIRESRDWFPEQWINEISARRYRRFGLGWLTALRDLFRI